MSGFCRKNIRKSLFSRSNLEEPVAASVEGGKDGRVNITAIDALQREKSGQRAFTSNVRRKLRGSLDIFAPGASSESR